MKETLYTLVLTYQFIDSETEAIRRKKKIKDYFEILVTPVKP